MVLSARHQCLLNDFLSVRLLHLENILSLELADLVQEVPRAQSAPAKGEYAGLVRLRVDSPNKHDLSHPPAVGQVKQCGLRILVMRACEVYTFEKMPRKDSLAVTRSAR